MQTSVLFCMQGLVVWGRSLITAGHKPQKPSFFLPVLILSSCLNSANLESVVYKPFYFLLAKREEFYPEFYSISVSLAGACPLLSFSMG